MDLFEEAKLKQRMAELVKKWKDKVPEKNTNEWWRYRADQSLYYTLKSKLNSPKNDKT